MRLGALLAAAALVLVTLVTAFPQVVSRDEGVGRSPNTQDHMDFTRELADHAAKLETLDNKTQAMADLPVRMARIEERLDTIGRMVLALLGGIFALLGKEIWSGMKSLRSRRINGGGE